MKATKTLILVILVAFSGCKSAPTIERQIRRIWSLNFNTCYCQFYDLNTVKNLTPAIRCENFFLEYFPDSPTLDNPEYCNDLVGYSAKDTAENITPWARELRRYGLDTCK